MQHPLLHKLERILKIDLHYVLTGGFWLTVGQIVSSASSLLLSIIFARYLPKEVFGNYKFIVSIFSIMSIATMPGMNIATTEAVVKQKYGTVFSALRARIAWGLLASLASFATAIYFYSKSNVTFGVIFAGAAFLLPLMDSFSIYDCVLQGEKKFRNSNIIFITNQLVVVILSALVVLLTKNLVYISLTYLASWTLVRGISLLRIKSKIPPHAETDPHAITFGKHMTAMDIFAGATGQIDKILAFHFLGAAPMAIYAFATGLPEQVRVVVANINTLLFPKFVEQHHTAIHKTMHAKMIKLSVLTISIVSAYIIAAPVIYKLLFPQYLDSVRYSQVFALSILNFTFAPTAVYLQAKKKIKQMYITNIVTPTFQIITMVFGIMWYGLMGLIVARVLTRFFSATLNLFLYQQVATEESEIVT